MNKFTLDKEYILYYYNFSDKLKKRVSSEFSFEWLVKSNILDHIIISYDELIIMPGFKWDGCSPKHKLFGKWWIGTPDGKIVENKPKMYYPSLVHDILYVNLEKIPFSRKTVDIIFYELAKAHDFRFAFLYYIFVRLFGGVYHCVTRFIKQRK
jgi:hypothetical protein